MISPITALITAKIRTAPAARSFASSASFFFSAVTRSTFRSSAEFIASALQTHPITIIRKDHSVVDTRNIKPQMITATVKKKWTLVFFS